MFLLVVVIAVPAVAPGVVIAVPVAHRVVVGVHGVRVVTVTGAVVVPRGGRCSWVVHPVPGDGQLGDVAVDPVVGRNVGAGVLGVDTASSTSWRTWELSNR